MRLAWRLGAGQPGACLAHLARGLAHEVSDFHTVRKNSPRALGVWPAHENGHIMSVGTRGNYIWAPGAHR